MAFTARREGEDAMQEPARAQSQWLTLEQASKRLGVHPTTLRRWADAGEIDVLVTSGGHRRFIPSDLDRFERQRHRTRIPAIRESWADHALAQTRNGLRAQQWPAAYEETERDAHRYIGRRLMGLLFQYIANSNECGEILSEARIIGEQHGAMAADRGRSLSDLLQAMSFFRTTLLEVALLESLGAASRHKDSSTHLLHRIERLVGEVQSGVVDRYLASATPCE